MKTCWTAVAFAALALAACSPPGDKDAAGSANLTVIQNAGDSSVPNAVAIDENAQDAADANAAAAAPQNATSNEQATAAPATGAPSAILQPAAAPRKPTPAPIDRAKYDRWERRIDALVENAANLDPAEVREDERIYRAERRRCATNACLDSSYRRQEAQLMKWDGAAELARQFPR